VVQGPSTAFNPTLQQSAVDAAIADDPEGARSEWEATFRSDLAAFLDDATIDAVVDHGRPLELPPRGLHYFAFVDPSGGRHDAFTLCIGHKVGYGKDASFVCDVLRDVRPPFDPQEVVGRFAALLREYKVTRVWGDGFSGEWVVSAFKEMGLQYERSDKPKSQLYLEALPLFTRGAISIPDHSRLVRELRLLERQTHRSGKDTVNHGRHGSDDCANALCGLRDARNQARFVQLGLDRRPVAAGRNRRRAQC
jgi:hypothetical protein